MRLKLHLLCGLFFLLSCPTIYAQLTQDDIIFYLPFDGDITDKSTDPPGFTITQGDIEFLDGEDAKFGQAASFNTASISTGNGGYFSTAEPFTVAAWFKLDALASETSSQIIMHQKDSDLGKGRYLLQVRGGGPPDGLST